MDRLLKELPADFPVCEEPFKVVGEGLGVDEDTLIRRLKALKDEGILRRFAAVLFHRKASYTHNAMVVWKVEGDRVEEAGRIMASFPEVSHCYERDKGGYWDYNLYTMIHGRSLEECMALVERIAVSAKVKEHKVFFSKREFKKTALVARYG